ncbi:hypothetical protein ACIQWN_06050 [Streptomyces vinaceus]|uniref:hypothetical protein n=1 Tax=Streptomyces vinaceus TaxID=1960 RepID=UPI00381AD11C
MQTLLDVLAVLVLIASLWQLISYSRWQRLECPECGLTMRFRCVSRTESKRLVQQMHTHVDSHAQKGPNQ